MFKQTEKPKKKFLYQNGVRFEVTTYGLVYAPQKKKQKKKHTCPDCSFCQWCPESRCSLCLSQRNHPASPPYTSPCEKE